MWKGVLHCQAARVPVKLYAAVEDRAIRFRLLSRRDQRPVRQALVHPDTGAIVPQESVRKAYVSEAGDRVILAAGELKALEPKESRDIEVLAFMPPAQFDHRWYDRPYFLGPDGSASEYNALADAMEATGLEGVARWVMRGRQYIGALRLHQGYPVLIVLRHAGEVVPAESLPAPEGPALDRRELEMARQLVEMLAADFAPDAYQDEYRQRVAELVAAKAKGRRLRLVAPRRKAATDDLSRALRDSLRAVRKSA
jgi:DNA end-binding protein Ku